MSTWTETTPGLYQRPLGQAELGLALAIAAERPYTREPFKIHCYADFAVSATTSQVTKAFRDAWKALRLLKSPDIAATFDGQTKQYRVPTAEELEKWLKQTFNVALTDTATHAAIRDMQSRLEWSPVLSIIPRTAPDGSFKGTVILYISHWRTEASGTFMLLDQLFSYVTELLEGTSLQEALSSHVLGSEVPLLSPTLEDMFMPNKTSTPESQARVAKYFAAVNSQLPSVDIPTKAGFAAPCSTLKLHHRIYQSSCTTELAVACRANDITVTSAINAAYLSGVWQAAEPSKKSRPWTCIMPAQVRKRLPASSPYREQGCWSAAQFLVLTSPVDQDFLTRARSLRQQYTLADQETWLYEDMRETSIQMVENSKKAPPEPSAMPFISSMGILDRDLLPSRPGPIIIDRAMVWADNVGPGIVLTLYTFRGMLNLQITWNAAYHSEEQVQGIMEEIDRTLAGELGVEMTTEEIIFGEC